MIFLKKSSLRAAVFKKRTGGMTVWLALCFLVFLALYQVCLHSVWKQFQRQRAEQAAEAGMFSLLSEYEPHLFERYDLFYLDTSFLSGTERTDEVCSHLWHFVEDNLTDVSGKPLFGLSLTGVNVQNLVRATDADGAVFFRQAIQAEKEKMGAALVEDWFFQGDYQETAEENSSRFQADCEAYEGTVVDYEDEDDEVDKEAGSFDGMWNSFTLSMAVPDSERVSEKTVDLTRAPSVRTLSAGSGYANGTEEGILEKQWFAAYLCDYMTHAKTMLSEPREDGYLDYQLEYIIEGKASDRENLEQVVQRLLLIREGTNYVFLLSHPEYTEKAERMALLLAGLTGSAQLVEGLKHLILLCWAYGESLVEVRQLLGGYELSVIKDIQDWQVPLSGLLPLIADPGKYDTQQKKQEGITYEAYLRFFLSLEPAGTLSMRALDIIEGEIQMVEGCQKIHLDHCVERLTAQIWMDGIYLERTSGYE